MKMKFVRMFAACVAAGLAFTSLGETSADGTEKPAAATALTSKNGTITSTSSGSFSSGPAAAFANDGSSRMLKQSKALNIMYTFSEATVVNCYGIKAGGSYFEAARGPKTWKIYGSNDYDSKTKNDAEANWVELDSRGQGDRCAETGWASGDYRFYSFANSTAYTTYKIDITDNNGNAYTQWQYMEYCYMQTNARSLTIESSTREVGLVNPGYGLSTQLIGDAVACSAFDGTWTGANDDETATCNGYVVYKDDDAGQWTEWWRGTDTSFVIESFPDANVKVVWDIAYSAEVGLSDFTHGKVVGDGWYEYGTSAELTATPDDGWCFLGWSNVATGEVVNDNPWKFVVSGPVQVEPKFQSSDFDGYYVSNDGSDTNEGSAERPFATIGHAVAMLGAVGGKITVFPGTYNEAATLVLDYPVQIVGSGETMDDVTISVANARVVELANEKASIEKVTIKGRTSGSDLTEGLAVHMSAGLVKSCRITGLNASVKRTSSGATVWMTGGRLMLCKVDSNTVGGAWNFAGGAGVYASAGVIENCLLVENVIKSYSDKTVHPCSALYLAGSAQIVNCTIAGNSYVTRDRDLYPNTVYVSGSATMQNCVIFGNALADSTLQVCGTKTGISSCAADVEINDNCFVVEDAGLDGDYAPTAASPLLDAGSDYWATVAISDVDFAGNPRISGETVDIGAIEYVSKGMDGGFVAVGETKGFYPFTATFKATVVGASGPVTYSWDFNGDGVAETNLTEDVVVWVYDEAQGAGVHPVVLTVNDGTSELIITNESAAITTFSRTMYVVQENPNACYPYSTRETAATNVNDAVDAAILDGITILVADGTYRQTQPIKISRGISLLGESGIAANVIVKNVTGYSGDTCANNLLLENADALVAGLTFTEAKMRNRGNVGAVTVHSGTVSNCVISAAEGQCSYYTQCSGLYMDGGLVTHCVIRDNTVDKKSTQGGETPGAMVAGGSLENSLVIGNTRGNEAEGICRTVFVSGTGRVVNCDILRNTLGCTVEGGARAVEVGNGATLQNCVVFDNKAKNDAVMGITASENANVVASLSEADGLTAAAFKRYDQGEFTPKSGGPLTDKGVTPEGWADLVDLAGKPRVIGSAVDIGCYEGNSAGLILNIW